MVSAYGTSARLLLGTLTFIYAAAGMIIIARHFDPLTALLLLAVFSGLMVLLGTKNYQSVTRLAAAVAPLIAKILENLEPIRQAFANAGHIIPRPRRKPTTRTKIYEKEDLVEFIEKQKRAGNNRIPNAELDAVLNALEFNSKRIREHMVSRINIHFVTPKDPIGPILLSELHKTGHSCFPVRGNGEDEIVGMLHLEDLIEDHKSGGSVADAMSDKVAYVNQEAALVQVLQAFFKTGLRVFMVVDSDRKITGLIGVNEVLNELIGSPLNSDFTEYDDAQAVSGKISPSP